MNTPMPAHPSQILDSAVEQNRAQEQFSVLVVASDLESRRAVTNILQALSIQINSCSTLHQAQQVLSLQRPNLIFCEERLPDGSYIDLLQRKSAEKLPPPLVVLTRTGEWELYMDATKNGAFDVIRSPWCPTNIELSVIRVAREEKHHLASTLR